MNVFGGLLNSVQLNSVSHYRQSYRQTDRQLQTDRQTDRGHS